MFGCSFVFFVFFRIGNDIDVQAELDSDIYNPEYNARVEYREPVLPPSSTLMLKLYTVDRVSRSLCCAGYGFLPIFVEVGTTSQPSVGSSQVKVGHLSFVVLYYRCVFSMVICL